jgi:hypothetical protein
MPLHEENQRLRVALFDLVTKLRLIHRNPVYQAVWQSAMVHGIDYKGQPTYEAELNAAEQLLDLDPQVPSRKTTSKEI